MNILVTLKQGYRTAEMSLTPLASCGVVKSIYVVRDAPGPAVEKVKYICPPSFALKYGALKTFSKLLIMLRLAITKKPELLAAYQSFPHGINAFLCAKLLSKPVVVNIMGSPKNWNKRKFLLPFLKRCNLLTVTGTYSREELSALGFDESKTMVLPDSIDISKYPRLSRVKKYDVIASSRLSSEKNLPCFLRALAEVKKKRPGLKAVIIGEGNMRSVLEKLSKSLGLSENLEMPGFVSDVSSYYNASKIFALTSFSEGLPRAMLEAMSCELPCVVSGVGDIKDAALHGENAFVVDDPNDFHAFANHINTLLESKELYESFSENTTQVRDRYCHAQAAAAWEKIINKLLQKKQAPKGQSND